MVKCRRRSRNRQFIHRRERELRLFIQILVVADGVRAIRQLIEKKPTSAPPPPSS